MSQEDQIQEGLKEDFKRFLRRREDIVTVMTDIKIGGIIFSVRVLAQESVLVGVTG